MTKFLVNKSVINFFPIIKSNGQVITSKSKFLSSGKLKSIHLPTRQLKNKTINKDHIVISAIQIGKGKQNSPFRTASPPLAKQHLVGSR